MHESNGVLNGTAKRFGFSDEAMEKARKEEAAAKAEAERVNRLQQIYQQSLVAPEGLRREDDELLVNVAGYAGPLESAPKLSRRSKPRGGSDTLWCEKVQPAEKKNFTLYSPEFYGIETHYRKFGTVLCFENHDFCEGGHQENTLRWHGFLHAWCVEDQRQVFLHFTPGGAKLLFDQLDDGASLRGLRISVARSKAKKGPFYVKITGIDSNIDKLPKHRDPLASIFTLFQIQPTDRRLSAKLCSRGEDIPLDQ